MNISIKEIFIFLKDLYGLQNWWPIVAGKDCLYLEEFNRRPRTSDEILEIMVGAVLTQNTSWENVVKAIINLKDAGIFSAEDINRIPNDELAFLVKPSGYFNQKAKKLKIMAKFIIDKLGGNPENLRLYPVEEARKLLLSLWGVGMETADSILLYGIEMPLFVVDAYTKRIFFRIGFFGKETAYEDMRRFFQENLDEDVFCFREYHALIVEFGKKVCRKTPLCTECGLNEMCEFAKYGSSYAQQCT